MQLTPRLQRVIKKFAQHLGMASLAFLVLCNPTNIKLNKKPICNQFQGHPIWLLDYDQKVKTKT